MVIVKPYIAKKNQVNFLNEYSKQTKNYFCMLYTLRIVGILISSYEFLNKVHVHDYKYKGCDGKTIRYTRVVLRAKRKPDEQVRK